MAVVGMAASGGGTPGRIVCRARRRPPRGYIACLVRCCLGRSKFHNGSSRLGQLSHAQNQIRAGRRGFGGSSGNLWPFRENQVGEVGIHSRLHVVLMEHTVGRPATKMENLVGHDFAGNGKAGSSAAEAASRQERAVPTSSSDHSIEDVADRGRRETLVGRTQLDENLGFVRRIGAHQAGALHPAFVTGNRVQKRIGRAPNSHGGTARLIIVLEAKQANHQTGTTGIDSNLADERQRQVRRAEQSQEGEQSTKLGTKLLQGERCIGSPLVEQIDQQRGRKRETLLDRLGGAAELDGLAEAVEQVISSRGRLPKGIVQQIDHRRNVAERRARADRVLGGVIGVGNQGLDRQRNQRDLAGKAESGEGTEAVVQRLAGGCL